MTLLRLSCSCVFGFSLLAVLSGLATRIAVMYVQNDGASTIPAETGKETTTTRSEGLLAEVATTEQPPSADTSMQADHQLAATKESGSRDFRRFEDSSMLANYIMKIATENSTLVEYFYGGNGGYAMSLAAIRAHYHFRMSNCEDNGRARGGAIYGGDLIHGKKKNDEPCFWSNMAPRKLLAIVAFAQKMQVSHIIESGRMGGMSAFMYDALGFSLTSVEYLPVESVQQDLKKYAPGIVLLNGDGSKVVPTVVKQLGSEKRIGVILDGPKHDAAYRLAMRLLDLNVAFVGIDDSQQLTHRIDKTPGIASFHLWDKRFLELFPLKREMKTVRRVKLQLPYISDGDCLSFLVKTS